MKVMKLDKSPHIFAIPDMDNLLRTSKHESLFVFGSSEEDKEKMICAGIGRVTFIEKGEKFDLVGMNFGRSYSRRIVVVGNHARRQIFTLKRGQLAWFYGYFKVYNFEKRKKVLFYAKGFQGWYVPKMVDIKNYEGEIDKIEDTDLTNYLDEIIGEQK